SSGATRPSAARTSGSARSSASMVAARPQRPSNTAASSWRTRRVRAGAPVAAASSSPPWRSTDGTATSPRPSTRRHHTPSSAASAATASSTSTCPDAATTRRGRPPRARSPERYGCCSQIAVAASAEVMSGLITVTRAPAWASGTTLDSATGPPPTHVTGTPSRSRSSGTAVIAAAGRPPSAVDLVETPAGVAAADALLGGLPLLVERQDLQLDRQVDLPEADVRGDLQHRGGEVEDRGV